MEIIFTVKKSLSHIVKEFYPSMAPINPFRPIYVPWVGALPHHLGYDCFGDKISDIKVEFSLLTSCALKVFNL